MLAQSFSWTRLPAELRRIIIRHLIAFSPNPKVFYSISYTFGESDCLPALHAANAEFADELLEIEQSRPWYDEGSDDGQLEDELLVRCYVVRARKEVVEAALRTLDLFEMWRARVVP